MVKKEDEVYLRNLFETATDIIASPAVEAEMKKMQRIAKNIVYAIQEKEDGYGHAVNCAASFAGGEACLLLLGDHLFRNNPLRSSKTCSSMAIDAFNRGGCKLTLLVEEVLLSKVMHYGIINGKFRDSHLGGDANRIIYVSKIVEKPSVQVYSFSF